MGMQFTASIEEPPLMEADVNTYQADDIARVEIIGPRASMIFIEYQFVGSVVVRMPVVCLRRLVADIPPESMERWNMRGIVTRYDIPKFRRRLM